MKKIGFKFVIILCRLEGNFSINQFYMFCVCFSLSLSLSNFVCLCLREKIKLQHLEYASIYSGLNTDNVAELQ